MILPTLEASEIHGKVAAQRALESDYCDDDLEFEGGDLFGSDDNALDSLMHSVVKMTPMKPRPPASTAHGKRKRGKGQNRKDNSNNNHKTRRPLTLQDKFRQDPELGKILLVIQQLPIIRQKISLFGPEKTVLDTVLDDLMWRVYLSRTDRQDVVLEDALDEYSRASVLSETGFCKLSLSIAVDSLRRLGKHSQLINFIYNQIGPAIFLELRSNLSRSAFGCIPWAAAATTGDAIHPDRPDVLEKLFNKASVERRGIFLAKLLKALSNKHKKRTHKGEGEGDEEGKETKHDKDQGKTRKASIVSQDDTFTTFSSETGTTKESSISVELEGLPLDISFRDDSMQLALRALDRPPSELIEMILRTYEPEAINEGLENYVIVPRLSQMLGRQSLALLGRRKTRLGRLSMTEKEEQEGSDTDEAVENGGGRDSMHGTAFRAGNKKDKIGEFISKSKLIKTAEDNQELRHRLLRNLIILEDDEDCLSDVLILLLDQITHAECSDDLYNKILHCDAVAVRVFTRKVLEISRENEEASVKEVHKRITIPYEDEATQKLFANKLGDNSNSGSMQKARNGLIQQRSFRRSFLAQGKNMSFSSSKKRQMSIKDARELLQDIKIDEQAFAYEDMPKVWQSFLKGMPELNPDEVKCPKLVKELVILDIFLWKINTDRARHSNGLGKRVFPMDFTNEALLPIFVVEYFMHQFGTKSNAQRMLCEFLLDINESKGGDEWVAMFHDLCALSKEKHTVSQALNKPVLDCVLLTLQHVAKHLPYIDINGVADKALPSLEVDVCLNVVTTLHSKLAYIDVEKAATEFERTRVLDKSTPSNEISLRNLLLFVYHASSRAARDREQALRTVFKDFGNDPSVEYDFEMFQSLINCGLERVHKRARNPALLPDIFNAMMMQVPSIAPVTYISALTLFSRPFPETSLYEQALQSTSFQTQPPIQ